MKKICNWQLLFGTSLVLISVGVYALHYWIFHDMHHIWIYFIGDLGFVFIEVLLVTLILHKLLGVREKQKIMKKLNMVIGVFFSEVGTELIHYFSSFDPKAGEISNRLIVNNKWKKRDFVSVDKYLKNYHCCIDSKKSDLKCLKDFLIPRRDFLLRLLENSNLLEHESFTDLLWAVFHLTEELCNRKDFSKLPDADYSHLSGDIKRAYYALIHQWLLYMSHLKIDYPYLFSLAIRTNPFDPSARVEITS